MLDSSVPLYDRNMLLERLSSPERPVVFLLGSALTSPIVDTEPGVPCTQAMVECVTEELSEQNIARLTSEANDHPTNRYQKAFELLLGARGQDAVNRVVRRAVLRARRRPERMDINARNAEAGNEESCNWLERDIDGWFLSPTLVALGDVARFYHEKAPAIVLTTNFDPLIELAIRRMVVSTTRTVLTEDGNLDIVHDSALRIAYLHGHWFRNDTLHTQLQVGHQRPRLADSLGRLLANRTLVVLGYGGWDDTFTSALTHEVMGGHSRLDVLWAFFEDSRQQISQRYERLLSILAPALARGRVLLYGGIDVHQFLPALRAKVLPDSQRTNVACISAADYIPAKKHSLLSTDPFVENGYFINYIAKEINIKIVYYGPALGGKTTNLQYIYNKTDPARRGQMISLATDTERTLFYDFLPISLGKVKDFGIRVHLYTVPGQVYYGASRKLILKGASGVVFVADSSVFRVESGIESMRDLRLHLAEQGRSLETIPFVMQYNKRDLSYTASISEMRAHLNPLGVPEFESVATEGQGVFDALKQVVKYVLNALREYAAEDPAS